MPTLIRLLVALLFLGALGYGGLYALTIFVDPGEKNITVRVPARDLVANPAPGTPSPDGTFDLGAPARPAPRTAPLAEPTAPAPGAANDFE